MFGQVDLVRVMVLNGAEGQLRVRATDTPLYGMTSVEIAEYMTVRTRNASRDAIVALLRARARRCVTPSILFTSRRTHPT